MGTYGVATEQEITSVIQKLDDKMRSAFKNLYGAANDDEPMFRKVVSSAMECGYIRRSDGNKWGLRDHVFEVVWQALEGPVLSALELLDLSDHGTMIEKPELYYGGQNLDKECLHVYEGKAVIRVPWSRIECVELSGEATELGPDWINSRGERPVNGEITMKGGQRQNVLLVGATVVGERPLGHYSLGLKDIKKLVPTVEMGSVRPVS